MADEQRLPGFPVTGEQKPTADPSVEAPPPEQNPPLAQQIPASNLAAPVSSERRGVSPLMASGIGLLGAVVGFGVGFAVRGPTEASDVQPEASARKSKRAAAPQAS